MGVRSSSQSPAVSGTPALVPQGKHNGKPSMPMGRPFTLVGSRHRAHLHLLSPTVSKAHAVIINDNGSLYIRDTASREHVIVNGQVVQESDLCDGDLLQIGSFKFKMMGGRKAGGKGPPRPKHAALEVEGVPVPVLFDGRALVIGRRGTCDIVLTELAVSNVHAIVYEFNGHHYIRDLGSRTGVYVNGEQVHQQALNFSDQIRIGDHELRFIPASGDDDELDELEHLIGTASLGEESMLLAKTDAARAKDIEAVPTRATPARPARPRSDDAPIPLDEPEQPVIPVARAPKPPPTMPVPPAVPPALAGDLAELDLNADPDVAGSGDTQSIPQDTSDDTPKMPVLSSRVVDDADVIGIEGDERQSLVGGDLHEQKMGGSGTFVNMPHDAAVSDSPQPLNVEDLDLDLPPDEPEPAVATAPIGGPVEHPVDAEQDRIPQEFDEPAVQHGHEQPLHVTAHEGAIGELVTPEPMPVHQEEPVSSATVVPEVSSPAADAPAEAFVPAAEGGEFEEVFFDPEAPSFEELTAFAEDEPVVPIPAETAPVAPPSRPEFEIAENAAEERAALLGDSPAIPDALTASEPTEALEETHATPESLTTELAADSDVLTAAHQSTVDASSDAPAFAPSPGTPGEGWGEGLFPTPTESHDGTPHAESLDVEPEAPVLSEPAAIEADAIPLSIPVESAIDTPISGAVSEESDAPLFAPSPESSAQTIPTPMVEDDLHAEEHAALADEPIAISASDDDTHQATSPFEIPFGEAVPPPFPAGMAPIVALGALGLPPATGDWPAEQIAPAPPADASLEVIEPTVPTLESAQNLEAHIGEPLLDEYSDLPAGVDELSDTRFGKAVHEFAGSDTGLVVEPEALVIPAEPAAAEVELPSVVADAAVSVWAEPEAIAPEAPTDVQAEPELAPVEVGIESGQELALAPELTESAASEDAALIAPTAAEEVDAGIVETQPVIESHEAGAIPSSDVPAGEPESLTIPPEPAASSQPEWMTYTPDATVDAEPEPLLIAPEPISSEQPEWMSYIPDGAEDGDPAPPAPEPMAYASNELPAIASEPVVEAEAHGQDATRLSSPKSHATGEADLEPLSIVPERAIGEHSDSLTFAADATLDAEPEPLTITTEDADQPEPLPLPTEPVVAEQPDSITFTPETAPEFQAEPAIASESVVHVEEHGQDAHATGFEPMTLTPDPQVTVAPPSAMDSQTTTADAATAAHRAGQSLPSFDDIRSIDGLSIEPTGDEIVDQALAFLQDADAPVETDLPLEILDLTPVDESSAAVVDEPSTSPAINPAPSFAVSESLGIAAASEAAFGHDGLETDAAIEQWLARAGEPFAAEGDGVQPTAPVDPIAHVASLEAEDYGLAFEEPGLEIEDPSLEEAFAPIAVHSPQSIDISIDSEPGLGFIEATQDENVPDLFDSDGVVSATPIVQEDQPSLDTHLTAHGSLTQGDEPATEVVSPITSAPPAIADNDIAFTLPRDMDLAPPTLDEPAPFAVDFAPEPLQDQGIDSAPAHGDVAPGALDLPADVTDAVAEPDLADLLEFEPTEEQVSIEPEAISEEGAAESRFTSHEAAIPPASIDEAGVESAPVESSEAEFSIDPQAGETTEMESAATEAPSEAEPADIAAELPSLDEEQHPLDEPVSMEQEAAPSAIAEVPVAEAPAPIEPAAPAPAAAPPPPAPRINPLLGMSRDFGSFLGGIPLPMPVPRSRSNPSQPPAAGPAAPNQTTHYIALPPPKPAAPPRPRPLFGDVPVSVLLRGDASATTMPMTPPTPPSPSSVSGQVQSMPGRGQPGTGSSWVVPSPRQTVINPAVPPVQSAPVAVPQEPPRLAATVPPASSHDEPAEEVEATEAELESPELPLDELPEDLSATDASEDVSSEVPGEEPMPELFDSTPEALDELSETLEPITDITEAVGEKPAPVEVQAPAAAPAQVARPLARQPEQIPAAPEPAQKPKRPNPPPPARAPGRRPTGSVPASGLTGMGAGDSPVDVFSQHPVGQSGIPEIPPTGFVPPGVARRPRPSTPRPPAGRKPGEPVPAVRKSSSTRRPAIAEPLHPNESDALDGMEQELDPADSAEPSEEAKKKKKRWKFPFFGMMLLSVTGGAAAAGAWYGLPPRSDVRAAFPFSGLDKLASAARGAFEREKHDAIATPEFRTAAQRIYENELHGTAGDGFLYRQADADVEFATIVDRARVEGDKLVLIRSGSTDAAGDVVRFRAVLKAISTPLAEQVKARRQALDLARADLAGAEEKLHKLADQKDKSQKRQEAFEAARKNEKLLADRSAELERAWHNAAMLASGLRSEVAAMEAAMAGPVPSGDEDSQLKEMTARLKQLADTIAAARNAQNGDPATAAAALNAALSQFQQQLDIARGASNAGSGLGAYLAVAQQAQSAIGQASADLAERQKLSRQTVADLKRTLAEKIDAFVKRTWSQDSTLAKLEQDCAVQEHRLGAAAGAGLNDEAVQIRARISELKKSIAGRRDAIVQAAVYPLDIKSMQKLLADQIEQMRGDQARGDQRIDEQFKLLAAAAPKADTLPADQRQILAQLDEKLSAVKAAHDQLSQIAAPGAVDIKSLESQLAEQTVQRDARLRDLANTARAAIPADPATLAQKRNALETASRNEARALGAWTESKEQLAAAQAVLNPLQSTQADLVRDNQQFSIAQARRDELKSQADRQAAAVPLLPQDPNADDLIQITRRSDYRPAALGFLGGIYAILTGWLLTRTRRKVEIAPSQSYREARSAAPRIPPRRPATAA